MHRRAAFTAPRAPARRAGVALLCATALCASAQTPSFSVEAQQRLGAAASPDNPQTLAQRQQLVAAGEARLAAGDASGALQAFKSAALIVHAADVELGLVRSYMQAGEYRRALAFGAHAAGAHRELPSGMALYAWLLHIGGQRRVAARTLDDWIARVPDDPVLLQARHQLSNPVPLAQGVLRTPPWRMAPHDESGAFSPHAVVTGSAVLSRDGRSALAPVGVLPAAQHIWVRNGLGQTARARVVQRLDDMGLALLECDTPLEAPTALAMSPTPPFAGSPNSMVEFSAAQRADAAWPILHQGFFGRQRDPLQPVALGIDAPQGPRGGPVFDRSGRLAGVALAADAAIAGADRMVPVASIAARLPGFWAPANPGGMPPPENQPMAIDSIYEVALRLTLQVIVDPDQAGEQVPAQTSIGGL